MDNSNARSTDTERPSEHTLIFQKGDDLTEALYILLCQQGYHRLLVWLTAKLVTSQDVGEWMRDIIETAEHDLELAQMAHQFFGLMIELDDREDAYDRAPIIRSAVQRRIARGLYRKLDATKREIRLLSINSATSDGGEDDTPDTVLSCSLEVRSLNDESLKFDALSYVWGDTTELIPIFVDGKAFLATMNLYEALMSFRQHGMLPGLIWVDAICINQHDVYERNHQVTLMTQLYQNAEKVRIWLGTETQHTAVLFDKLEDCGGDQNRPGAGIMNAIKLLNIESGSINGLLDLLSRRWWCRLWVVQEAALAQDPVVYCGSQTFCFRRLEEILRTLTTMISEDVETTSPVYMALSKAGLGRIQQLSTLVEISQNHGYRKSPTNLLDGTTHCESTVQHDRVYALLGLLSKELNIIPDYNVPVQEVFESAAARIFQWSGCLDLLRITALTYNRKMTLPSWVPEFGNTPDALYLYRTGANFKADLGATCSINRERRGKLVVRALIFDEIWVSSLPFNHEMPESTAMSSRQLHERLKMRRDLLQSTTQNGAIDVQAFWQTLTTNRLINAASGGQRWEEDGGLELADQWDAWVIGDAESLKGELPERLLSCFWEAHCGASFFVSTQGRMGLGDAAPTQKGDVLAVLAGSDDPALLRPCPENGRRAFKFVQNCYFHGGFTKPLVIPDIMSLIYF